MESIHSVKEMAQLKENKVISPPEAEIVLENSSISFQGENNLLYIEHGVKIKNSKLAFCGSNGLLYLSASRHTYFLNASIYNNSVLYMGKNNYFNGILNMVVSEQTHILIGDDGLFSFGIWMRTADAHLVYDVHTKQRKNYSSSIFVGDHVWIGQNVFLLKGTQIGSGSTIGAMAVVSGKKIPSNTAWAGNPARMIGKDIFFTPSCVHGYTDEKTRESAVCESEQWIYDYDIRQQISFEEINRRFTEKISPDEKLNYIRKTLKDNVCKNRFYMGTRKEEEDSARKNFFRRFKKEK